MVSRRENLETGHAGVGESATFFFRRSVASSGKVCPLSLYAYRLQNNWPFCSSRINLYIVLASTGDSTLTSLSTLTTSWLPFSSRCLWLHTPLPRRSPLLLERPYLIDIVAFLPESILVVVSCTICDLDEVCEFERWSKSVLFYLVEMSTSLTTLF